MHRQCAVFDLVSLNTAVYLGWTCTEGLASTRPQGTLTSIFLQVTNYAFECTVGFQTFDWFVGHSTGL